MQVYHSSLSLFRPEIKKCVPTKTALADFSPSRQADSLNWNLAQIPSGPYTIRRLSKYLNGNPLHQE